MSGFRIDHAVVLVSDLDRAVADYREMGFTVTPGGTHSSGGTRNALVPFRDGSYLELLSFMGRLGWGFPWLRRLGLAGWAADRREGLERRFLLNAGSGEGLIDFALLPPSLRTDLEHTRSAGLQVEGPLPGGRTRPDGEEVAWELGIPRTADLPFLCADLTEHDLRVPGGEARDHANGITGISGVVVAVRNLEASSARYRALLGVDPVLKPDAALSGNRVRVFPLDGGEVSLASAAGSGDPIRARLRAGEGPFALRLRYEGGPPTLDRGRMHGARLDLGAPPRPDARGV